MIELTLAEDIPEIAKSGDKILLKDDGKFEIRKEEGAVIQKPFADYKDFADCVSKNKDKENPDAYCGQIKHKIESEVEKESNEESYEERRDRLSYMQQPGYKSKYDESGYNLKPKKKVEKEYDPRIEKYLSIDKEKSWALLTKFYKDGHLDSYVVLKDFINKIATCPDVTEKFEKIMDGWMKDGEADTASIEKIIDSCKKEGGNVVREGDDKKAKSESIVKEILNLH